jgi:single-strand DNA-binding protein
MNYQKTQIIGRLTKDVELKHTPTGTAVGKTTIAVSANHKNKDETLFMPIVMFGITAENAAKFIQKGSGLFVEGRLKEEKWDDKATGQKRSMMTLVVDNMQFLDSKRDGGSKPQASSQEQDDSHDDIPF